MIILKTSTRSQHGPGAQLYRWDCGAAVAVNLIQDYTGKIVTPDQFYKDAVALGATFRGLPIKTIKVLLERHRVSVAHKWGRYSLDGMRRDLDCRVPILIHLPNMWHYALVVGYYSGGFWVEDPNDYRGPVKWTTSKLKWAMGRVFRNALVPRHPLPS